MNPPSRSNTSRLTRGRGHPASSCHTSRKRGSCGDLLRSSARARAERASWIPRAPPFRSRKSPKRRTDVSSAAAVMSTATTASRRSATCAMWSSSARSGSVHLMPWRTTTSHGGGNARTAIMSTVFRSRADPTITITGSRVMPSGPRPSKYAARWSRRLAQPVTTPSSGDRANASTIRCSGTAPSTREGTWRFELLRRHRGPAACPRVGPTRPAGSTGTGHTTGGGPTNRGRHSSDMRWDLPGTARSRNPASFALWRNEVTPAACRPTPTTCHRCHQLGSSAAGVEHHVVGDGEAVLRERVDEHRAHLAGQPGDQLLL